jgi:hypothetical protein
MKRVWHVAVLAGGIAIFAHQRFGAEPLLALPFTAGEWKLAAPQSCLKPVPAELLQWRGTTGARQVCRAVYDGDPSMKLTLYDMPEVPGATAFDAGQKFPAGMSSTADARAGKPVLQRLTLSRVSSHKRAVLLSS